MKYLVVTVAEGNMPGDLATFREGLEAAMPGVAVIVIANATSAVVIDTGDEATAPAKWLRPQQ